MSNEQKQRGRFIVFEGIDGAGKTTQIELLEKRLQKMGRAVYRTAEPTESVSGGLLRDALAGVSKRSACELAALFTLDRIFHNVNPVNASVSIVFFIDFFILFPPMYDAEISFASSFG